MEITHPNTEAKSIRSQLLVETCFRLAENAFKFEGNDASFSSIRSCFNFLGEEFPALEAKCNKIANNCNNEVDEIRDEKVLLQRIIAEMPSEFLDQAPQGSRNRSDGQELDKVDRWSSEWLIDCKHLSTPKKSRSMAAMALQEPSENVGTIETARQDPANKQRPTRSPHATKRRSFSCQEEEFLHAGVRKYGVGKWTKILKSYPFNARTAVNLKDKWRNLLQKAES